MIVKSRHDEFAKKYETLNFSTLRAALTEPGGWNAIAQKPDWGRFTFAITRPSMGGSGLATLALMAFDFHGKDDGLTTADVESAAFMEWARGFERGFKIDPNAAQAVNTIVLKGPSAYDGVVTYESLVLTELEDIEDRWGPAQLVYPAVNIWNETSYYVLDTPWNTAKSRRITDDFLQFLLSERAQKQLVLHGFRPANPRVKIHFDGSPFNALRERGVDSGIPITVEPATDVVAALMKVAAALDGLAGE
jgi:ABC-type sulfate transport system substrate-binding protein